MGKKVFHFLDSRFPLIFFILLTIIFFYPFFLKHLIPMPADITIGAYHPWLDYKWGTVTGIPIKNALPSDVPSLLFPNKQLAMKLLFSGHLPDLNKFILSGTELLSNSLSAVFYPLNLIYLVTDFVTGWSWQVILQPFMALITTYLLARYLKLSRIASLFSATTFAFSGFLITWVEYNAQSQPLTLLPLVVLTALKSFDKPSLKNYALYSLSLGLQLLAGYPLFVIYTLAFTGLCRLIYRLPRLKDLITFSIFTLLGIAFSGIQLLPFIDFLSSSTRSSDSGSLVGTNLGFFPFKHLVTLLAPNFFGNPATLNYTGTSYFDNFSTYPTVLALILSFYTLRVKHRIILPLWLGVILALVLSIKTPLSFFLFQNNILGFGAAIAARAMSLLTFCLAILSGIGLNYLLSQKKPSLFYFLPFLLLLVIFWLVPGFVYLKIRYLPDATLINTQLTTLRNLVIPTLTVLAATGLLFLYRFLPKKFINPYSAFVGFSFVLIVFVDLFLFGKKYLSFVPRSYIFPTTPVIDYLIKNAGHDRILGGDVIPLNMLMAYSLKSAAGYETLYSSRYASFLGHLLGQEIPTGRVGNINTYPDAFDFNSTATRYILAKKYLKDVPDPKGEVHTEFQLQHLKPVFSDGSVLVLENTKRLPLVYLQPKDSTAISPITTFTEHFNGDFDIYLESTSSADLVVATTYSPSWNATIDSRPFPLTTSNRVYLSLNNIPPGKHQVRLTYHPRTFSVAIATTIFSGLIISFLVFSKSKSRV